jgi:two-component system OmpR family response regulator
MQKRLALVEDDDILRVNYVDLLSRAGFSVAAYSNKEDALHAFTEVLPDIVLLDIALGSERDAGFEICSVLRRRSTTLPIVFLTSHDGDVDKISGLRLGADDYLTKDVSIDYLTVRIETLLRRLATIAAAGSLAEPVMPGPSRSSLEIVDSISRARWNGIDVGLPLTQYWMVRELYCHSGQVISHADLMRAARIVVEPNTVTAHVKAIRDAFRGIDPEFNCIRTERGRGYRWVPLSSERCVTAPAEAARR